MNDNLSQTIQLDGPYLDILRLRQNGLCCSQIVVKLVLGDLGKDNPDLVRAMAVLCFGTSTGGVCGVFTGAACALSLYLGHNAGSEQPDLRLTLLLGELSDWFTIQAERSYGGSMCADILKASPDKRACSLLLISTLEKLKTMMATAGSTEKGREDDHP